MSMFGETWPSRGTWGSRRGWGSPWNAFSRLEDVMMDMERQMAWMEREMMNAMRNLGVTGPRWGQLGFTPRVGELGFTPRVGELGFTPRVGELGFTPRVGELGYSGTSTESESGVSGEPRKYTMNIHLGNIAPEDVKVSLKDHVLTVEAKKEFKSDDGNARLYHEYVRKFTLPDNVDMKEVKSILTPEGYLKVEAPLPQQSIEQKEAQSQPQAIPIQTQ